MNTDKRYQQHPYGIHILLYQVMTIGIAPMDLWEMLRKEGLYQTDSQGEVQLTPKGQQYIEELLREVAKDDR